MAMAGDVYLEDADIFFKYFIKILKFLEENGGDEVILQLEGWP